MKVAFASSLLLQIFSHSSMESCYNGSLLSHNTASGMEELTNRLTVLSSDNR